MAEQPIAAEVAPGIYQVRLPLPFALNSVNVYLLRDGDGWTVLDTGLNTEAARAVWQAVFAQLDILPGQIRRVILTHTHPDHFGMAGWFQSLTPEEVPTVYMSEEEAAWVRHVWQKEGRTGREFDAYLVACGMPDDMIETVARSMDHTSEQTLPHPTRTAFLKPGDLITIGERQFEAIHAPGHSDGQLIFYDAADRLLLSGDHVLMKITPNIGLWPESQPDPLGQYLGSLRSLLLLDVRLALPGHKTLINDWQGRLGELLAHHDARLEHTLKAIETPITVYDASLKVFDSGKFSPHEWRFAMAETLAHLEHLRLAGRAQREMQNGRWLYSRT